jgi:alkanesulfonate monooxygenase SsuD/methylene tetrahydromethanopterin reductase-like flavin-dependent oxidoreductase (luciferase family)
VAAMRACWGPDPVAYEGRFYRIAPSQVNPKPVQAHLPILVGAMTPAGVRRAARIADGINPIAFAAEQVLALVKTFRAAAQEQGRDPATLTVAVRANVPLTSSPMGDDRPYLGGSPAQVAADLAPLREAQIDHVLFSNTARSSDIDAQVDLLAQLQETVAKG